MERWQYFLAETVRPKGVSPLQVAEYAFSVGIVDEQVFNWQVTWVLKKRDLIISLVKHQNSEVEGTSQH